MAIHDAFTRAEDEYLIQNYPIKPWDELITELNSISPVTRTKTSIICRASTIGIKRMSTRFGRFTEEEDRLITEVYSNSSDQTIAHNLQSMIDKYMPHRTLRSVQKRINILGLKCRREWSEQDDKFLIENYYYMTTAELATVMNRTDEAIYNRVRKYQLRGAPMSMYTEADKEFIRNNYLTMNDDEIGKVLHRRGQSIKEFRRKLGLYKPRPEGVIYNFQQYIQRHNSEWKKASMERCKYKCVITGGAFNDIHHLYAKSLIICEVLEDHPEYENINFNDIEDESQKQKILNDYLEVQNKYPLGVCLAEEYHMLFHRMYGFGYNTPDQFISFVEEVAPDRLDYIMSLL